MTQPRKPNPHFDIQPNSIQAIHAATVLETWLRHEYPKLQLSGWVAVVEDIRNYARLVRDHQPTTEAVEPPA